MSIMQNATNVTLDQLIAISNVTSMTDWFVNINTIVYQGWLFFILTLLMWIIMFIAMQLVRPEALVNFTYTGGIISILSIILMVLGLMTATLAFIPGLLTVLAATIMWATKER